MFRMTIGQTSSNASNDNPSRAQIKPQRLYLPISREKDNICSISNKSGEEMKEQKWRVVARDEGNEEQKKLFDKKYWKLPGEAVTSYYDLLQDCLRMGSSLVVKGESKSTFDIACRIGCLASIKLLLRIGYEVLENSEEWRESGKLHGYKNHTVYRERWEILRLPTKEFAEIMFKPDKIMALFPRTANKVEYKTNQRKLEQLVVEEKKKIIGELMDLGFVMDKYFLRMCVSIEDSEYVEFMLEKGMEVNFFRRSTRTPIHNCHIDFLPLLVKCGADLNATTDYLPTPLSQASSYNDAKRVEMLISLGAEVNSQDESGLYPLHIACKKGYEKVAKMLVNAGADITVPCVEGLTPVHYAHRNDMKELLALISLKHGEKAAKLTSLEGYVELIKCVETKRSDDAAIDLAKQYGCFDLEDCYSANGDRAALFAVTINKEEYKGVYGYANGNNLQDASIHFVSEESYKSFTLKNSPAYCYSDIDHPEALNQTANFLTWTLGIAEKCKKHSDKKPFNNESDYSAKVVEFAINGVLRDISDISNLATLLGGPREESSEEESDGLLGEFIKIDGD